MVANGAWASAGCFPAEGEWKGHGTLAQAKAKCSAEPTCTTLHDYGNDGNAWRACAGTMAGVANGAAATLTIVRRVDAFGKGPMVSNGAYSSGS
eukprot:gene56807-biopygen64742